jgi:hypothetical protein
MSEDFFAAARQTQAERRAALAGALLGRPADRDTGAKARAKRAAPWVSMVAPA